MVKPSRGASGEGVEYSENLHRAQEGEVLKIRGDDLWNASEGGVEYGENHPGAHARKAKKFAQLSWTATEQGVKY